MKKDDAAEVVIYMGIPSYLLHFSSSYAVTGGFHQH